MVRKRLGLVFVAVLLSFCGATHFVAHRLGYADALGKPLLEVGRTKLYTPWRVLVWHHRYGKSHGRVFREALLAPCLVTLAVAWLIGRHRSPPVKAIGKDRWGGLRDLKRAGLLAGRGLVVGRAGRRVLTFDSDGHVLVVGGTRSGKTVGVVIPSLLTWPGSVAVFDPKGELWRVTAGFRSRFSHCVYFNPTRTESIKWNPLLEVRPGHEVRDAQNIAHILADPAGEKNQFDIWDITASQLVTAAILHVLYTAPDQNKHLGTVRDLVLDLDSTCLQMMTTPHVVDPGTGQPKVHDEVMLVAKSLMTAAPRFRSSVRATAESYLSLFADPLVRANTSRSDWVIGELMCCDTPMSLYIQAPPSDAARLRPLTRLVLSQTARGLMEHEKLDPLGRAKKHELLYLLEEFSSFGRLSFFEQNMRQMASYGLRAMLVVQSFNDVMQHYGSHQSLIDNCQVVVAFASNDTATQSRVSQMAGNAVEYRAGYSQPHALATSRGSTRSLSEQVRPLLQPGDVRQLPDDRQLVFVTGFKPFKTQKVRYYQQRPFRGRVMAPPDQREGVDLPKQDRTHPWKGQQAKGPPIALEEPLLSHGDDSQGDGQLLLNDLTGPDEPGLDDRFAL